MQLLPPVAADRPLRAETQVPHAARRLLIPSAVVSQELLQTIVSHRLISTRVTMQKLDAPAAESGFAEDEEASAAAAAAWCAGLPLHEAAAAAGEASASSPSLPLSVVSPSDAFTRGSATPLLPPLDDLDEDDFLNAFVMPSSLCSPQRTCEVLNKMHVGMEVLHKMHVGMEVLHKMHVGVEVLHEMHVRRGVGALQGERRGSSATDA